VFAKVFEQIFDSSIAEDYTVRHCFMDLLALADPDGVIDMTHDAIARRTNVPLDIVRRCISELSKPDPASRSKKSDGRRIVPIDSHRQWGWRIVNYRHYRALRDEEGRRSYFRNYMRDRRKKLRGKPVNARKHSVKDDQQLSTQGEGEEDSGTHSPMTLGQALEFGQKQHPPYEPAFIRAWFEHREAQDPPWTKTNGMAVTDRNWQADLTKWVMGNLRGDFRSGGRAPAPAKPRVIKPKSQEPIPDKMRSWLAEFLNDDEQLRKWKTVGDIPEAYRQSYWAAQQKKDRQ
jgi:hypothetical protein